MSHAPDAEAIARQTRTAVTTTGSAATVRATAHVEIGYQPSRYELTGTVDRTAAGFAFTGTSTVYGLGRASTRKLRVIDVGGRAYARLPADGWTPLSAPERTEAVTGSSTIDVAVLDPWLYLSVMNPAYWTDPEGIGMPEAQETASVGGTRTRHYNTGCGYDSSLPGCDWARLGSLFRTWHGSPSDATEQAWIDERHIVRRITARWGLYSPAGVPIEVEARLDLATLATPVPISEPPVR